MQFALNPLIIYHKCQLGSILYYIMKSVIGQYLNRINNSIFDQMLFKIDLKQAVKHFLKSGLDYHQTNRLPRNDLRTAIKIPCPISQSLMQQFIRGQINPKITQQISVFKKLRYNNGIDQVTHCAKCPKNSICKFTQISLPDLLTKSQHQHLKVRQFLTMKKVTKFAEYDLMFFFMSIMKQNKQQYSKLRWEAMFRVITSLQILLRDAVSLQRSGFNAQSYLYNQSVEIQQNKVKSRVLKGKSSDQYRQINIKQSLKNRKYKMTQQN